MINAKNNNNRHENNIEIKWKYHIEAKNNNRINNEGNENNEKWKMKEIYEIMYQ